MVDYEAEGLATTITNFELYHGCLTASKRPRRDRGKNREKTAKRQREDSEKTARRQREDTERERERE